MLSGTRLALFALGEAPSGNFFFHERQEAYGSEMETMDLYYISVPGGSIVLGIFQEHRKVALKQLPETTEQLIETLNSSNKWLAFCAAEALAERKGAAISALPGILKLAQQTPEIFPAVESIAKGAPEQAAPLVAAALAGPCVNELIFLKLLGELRVDTPAIGLILLEKCRTGDCPTQAAAAKAIFQITGSCDKALPFLVRSLFETPDHRQKKKLLETLGEFGPKATEAVGPIVKLMARTDATNVLCSAVLALGKIGRKPEIAIPRIVELTQYTNKANHRFFLASGIEAIAGFGAEGVPALLEFYRSTNVQENLLAAKGLALVGPAAAAGMKPYLDDLHTSSPRRIKLACRILSSMGENSSPALPQLRALLGYPDNEVRIAAAAAVWKLEGESLRVLPALVKGLDDPKVGKMSVQTAVLTVHQILVQNPTMQVELEQRIQEHSRAAQHLRNRRAIVTLAQRKEESGTF